MLLQQEHVLLGRIHADGHRILVEQRHGTPDNIGMAAGDGIKRSWKNCNALCGRGCVYEDTECARASGFRQKKEKYTRVLAGLVKPRRAFKAVN